MPPRTRLQAASPTKPVICSPSKVVPSPKKTKASAKSPTKTYKTTVKQALVEPLPAPPRWKEAYELIVQQRQTFTAPVDVMGCDKAGDVDFKNGFPPSRREEKMDAMTIQRLSERSEKDRRLACLVSLMLSSQTKDEITAQATLNLRRELKGSLTVDSLRNSSLVEIENCINKVGFWRKKAVFLKEMAQDLFLKHDSDVPKTIDELVALKGVGPKMAFLALSNAWSLNVGIGVDTHVHRISNRLGWVKTTDPEGTRVQLESWLPHDLFQKINHLLVGFGQVVCLPVGPKCATCFVGKVEGLCPSSNLKSKLVKKRKTVTKVTTEEKGPSLKKTRKKLVTIVGDVHVKEEEEEGLQSSRFFNSQITAQTVDSIKNEKEEKEEHDDKKVGGNEASTSSQVKIELEGLIKDQDVHVKEENHNNIGDNLSSPLSEIIDQDQDNIDPPLCSSQLLSW